MNRMLVEQATHPDALRTLAEELGGEWLAHEQTIVGAESAEALLATRHCLDRTAPFDERLTFADLDEDVRTRLGEDGPRIVLQERSRGRSASRCKPSTCRAIFSGPATVSQPRRTSWAPRPTRPRGASHCTSVPTVSSTIAKDCAARIDPVANDTKHA